MKKDISIMKKKDNQSFFGDFYFYFMRIDGCGLTFGLFDLN